MFVNCQAFSRTARAYSAQSPSLPCWVSRGAGPSDRRQTAYWLPSACIRGTGEHHGWRHRMSGATPVPAVVFISAHRPRCHVGRPKTAEAPSESAKSRNYFGKYIVLTGGCGVGFDTGRIDPVDVEKAL